MTTPVYEREVPIPPPNSRSQTGSAQKRPGAEDDGSVVDEGFIYQQSLSSRPNDRHLAVSTDSRQPEDTRSIQSPSRLKEEASRLDDDLTVLQAERQVSVSDQDHIKSGISRSRSIYRSRSKEPQDAFDIATEPTHEKLSIYRPPQNPNTSVGKIFKKVHDSVWLLRYFLYITPLVLLLLIPLLLGALVFRRATVGGVQLVWFSIWLEIVWLSLWAGRILSKCLPWPIGLVSSLFTNNSKKWRDMGKQLEMPATLFFWGLALEISFLPTMKNHHADGNRQTLEWETVMNKVIISIFVCTILNFAEKIIIQLIAISFHLRTYSDRIDVNKFQIGSLTKLYQFSKEKISEPDEEFENHSGVGSGTRTPAHLVKEAQKNTVEAFKKIGDVTGKIAGDFAGKSVVTSSHPHQVILNLLSSTDGSQVLARRLYRTFCREAEENVHSDELRPAFDNDEEAEAAFMMFDKDMNGDISLEELESVCVEIGRERKSITASLKDLDSVISKLDSVFLFIVLIITILVFISLISTSAAGVLTSAGSTVLALSWLFSATAQEFLQSIIFVFVKHPFDVGDRVSIYGNTGSTLKGDDYFVKEISLLYTEFKKMEGHIVQAPNSYLNQLFILNQRRSGGLAEAVPVVVKFGTTLDQIDSLRLRLLDFVRTEKREYQSNILTELRDITEAHSITLNVVFFYKSNWQNELLRLQRRNKFICALMVSIQELGIEGPRMRYPGQKESSPVYLQHIGRDDSTARYPDNKDSAPGLGEPPFIDSSDSTFGTDITTGQQTSVLQSQGRKRGESLAQMGRRIDFSLGMQAVSSSDLTGDVFEDRRSPRLPPTVTSPTRSDHSTSIGRSTSFSRGLGGAQLTRVGTDSTLARQRSNHRNRFFGRRGDMAHDDSDIMEAGMADIPENSYLDPRSGLVSAAAWRTSSETHRPGTIHSLPMPVTAERGDEISKIE